MAFLTARPEHRAALRERLGGSPPMMVVGLCAAWCGTCRDFEADFARLAAAYPQALFIWLDIEDDSEIVGDVDVENFPTLAVFRAGAPVHFGISLPQEGVVRRVLEALARDDARAIAVPDAVATLPRRIAGHAG
jgi:thioredoxin reductase (NADPH)